MDDIIFDECEKEWRMSVGNQPFWNELALKHKYPSGESLRSAFKRERKKRGVAKTAPVIQRNPEQLPKVGVMDVETLFIIGGAWGLFDQNIGINQIIKDSCMLSWAGKYLFGNGQIFGDIMTPEEATDRDTERITKSAWDFVNSCEIMIGHNFRGFDAKVLNTEFLKNGMKPTKYRVVDTYEVARNNFRFSSNKMEFINATLGIREKIPNDGFPLWLGCSDGDQESLDKMMEYNVGDIVATEELFWKVQPFVSNIANFSMYNRESVKMACTCGCERFLDAGYIYTNSAKYNKLRCENCGAIFRGKTNYLPTLKREKLLVRV